MPKPKFSPALRAAAEAFHRTPEEVLRIIQEEAARIVPLGDRAAVAQGSEHRTRNAEAAGSTPAIGSLACPEPGCGHVAESREEFLGHDISHIPERLAVSKHKREAKQRADAI